MGKTRLAGDLVKVLAENYWQNSRVGNIEIYLLAVERIILVSADKIIFCWCSFCSFSLNRSSSSLLTRSSFLGSLVVFRFAHCGGYSNRFIIKEGNSLKNCTLYIDNPTKLISMNRVGSVVVPFWEE